MRIFSYCKIKLDFFDLASITILVSSILYLIINYFNNGTLLNTLTFHDHFTHFLSMNDKNLYPNDPALVFPPLAYLIYSFLLHQDWQALRIGADFTDNVLNNKLPSNSYFVAYIFLTCVLLLIAFCFIYILHIKFKKTIMSSFVFSFAICISYPMIQAIESGNIIILAFLCTLLFTIFYDSNNYMYKLISLIFLSIAINIKIYPLFFVLSLLSNREYKSILTLIVISSIIFILPFFYFNGFVTMIEYVKNLFSFSNMQIFTHSNIYYGFSVIFNKYFHLDTGLINVFLKLIAFTLILFSIILALLLKNFSSKLFYICFLCVNCFINNYPYNYIFLIISFIYFIYELNNISAMEYRNNCNLILILICYLLLFSNYSFGALHILPTCIIFICIPIYEIRKIIKSKTLY